MTTITTRKAFGWMLVAFFTIATLYSIVGFCGWHAIGVFIAGGLGAWLLKWFKLW